MTEAALGHRVIERGRSRDSRFPWVVLCEQPDGCGAGDRYVVWYEDRQGRRSVGYFTSLLDDAELEFERRT